MRFRNLVVTLAVGCLISGVGCFNDEGVAQTQDESKQADQEIAERTKRAKQVAELGRQTSKAFASGEYGLAVELSNKIVELEPDNVFYHMHRGTICFAAGKMADSVSSYDEAIRLQPAIEPRLWQRGLALYYADRFDDGRRQFETHQSFNSQDVENAVWHLLCTARLSDVETARKKLIPITEDTRVPMSQIYEMFAGRMTPEQVLARAEKTAATIRQGSEEHKLQLYFAHLYTGLYHEMLQDPVAAKASLKNAAEINPLGKTNFMGQVARVHLLLMESGKPEKDSHSGKRKK